MRIVSYEKGTREAVKIGLDSGSFFLCRLPFFGEGAMAGAAFWEDAAARGLEAGEDVLPALEACASATVAERDALKKLALRERSRAELELALRKKGHASAAIRLALDSLEAEGSLSDGRFAEAFLRSRLRSRPEGESLLRARLGSKGVSRDLVSGAISENREAIASGIGLALKIAMRQEERRLERRREKADSPGIAGDPKSELSSAVYRRLRALGYARQEVMTALEKFSRGGLEIDESDEST
jgi:SOS response regulatory protein OraA/RecX